MARNTIGLAVDRLFIRCFRRIPAMVLPPSCGPIGALSLLKPPEILEEPLSVRRCQLTLTRPRLILMPASEAMSLMPKVTVLPAEKSAEVEPGELLLEAGEKAGVEMEAGCFNCSCGTCVVEIVSGMENLAEPTPEE